MLGLSVIGLGSSLGRLLPVLKLIGIDPEKIAKNYVDTEVKKKLLAGVPAVVSRMTADKMTLADKGDMPEAERLVIRAAMYLLLKEVFRKILPSRSRGANLVADFIRDQHD